MTEACRDDCASIWLVVCANLCPCARAGAFWWSSWSAVVQRGPASARSRALAQRVLHGKGRSRTPSWPSFPDRQHTPRLLYGRASCWIAAFPFARAPLPVCGCLVVDLRSTKSDHISMVVACVVLSKTGNAWYGPRTAWVTLYFTQLSQTTRLRAPVRSRIVLHMLHIGNILAPER